MTSKVEDIEILTRAIVNLANAKSEILKNGRDKQIDEMVSNISALINKLVEKTSNTW